MINKLFNILTSILYVCLIDHIQFGKCQNHTESDANRLDKSNNRPVSEPLPKMFFNLALDKMNPDSIWPPRTDAGDQPPFKYPFSFSSTGKYSGGWVRQVTVRDLPISTKMAGVQMRLYKGGVRELHWHQSTEWAFMIYGEARITLVDSDGRAFVDDVQSGDLWLFPSGFPHSIQGIGDNGALFILVFDDGNFSDFDAILLTDWMIHTPKEVLAENFAVPEQTFANLPKEPLYMFTGQMPLPLPEDQEQASKVTGTVPQPYLFYTDKMEPNFTRTGGYAKIIDRRNFPVTNIAVSIITLKPGGLRELHWHPNADEWQYYVTGKARMTVFNVNQKARTMDFQAGDVGYVEKTVPHYIQNTGDEDVVFLAVFADPYYEDISLALWLAHTPPLLVNEHIRTGEKFINEINKTEAVVQPVIQ